MGFTVRVKVAQELEDVFHLFLCFCVCLLFDDCLGFFGFNDWLDLLDNGLGWLVGWLDLLELLELLGFCFLFLPGWLV